MVEIKLTDSEVRTLRFYLEKALIDARGMAAVGVCGRIETIGAYSKCHV